MNAFRLLLGAIFVAVGAYTAPVFVNHGPNLFGPFFADLAEVAWPGQFNFDFMMMLVLSGSWIAWRHHFTGKGIALGIGGFFLGAPFLTGYLLYQSRGASSIEEVLARPARGA